MEQEGVNYMLTSFERFFEPVAPKVKASQIILGDSIKNLGNIALKGIDTITSPIPVLGSVVDFGTDVLSTGLDVASWAIKSPLAFNIAKYTGGLAGFLTKTAANKISTSVQSSVDNGLEDLRKEGLTRDWKGDIVKANINPWSGKED